MEMQLVSFTYNGGTKPGQTRKVYLTAVREGSFTGYDFTAKGYRQFTQSNVSNLAQSVEFDWFNYHNESDKSAAIEELEKRGLETFVDESKKQVVGVAV
jgi:hypothetical protein